MRYQLIPGQPAGTLGVIGNISRDLVTYPDGRTAELLGGAALHVALAAARAGLHAAPVAVIGTDLAWLISDSRLVGVDLSNVQVAPGDSCAFGLSYDEAGQVADTTCAFGVSEELTSHALRVLGTCLAWHVCCRRPLAAAEVLDRLAASGVPFSVDFHIASAHEVMTSVRATLPHATALFVNAAELAILAKVVDVRVLRMVVVSDGPRAAKVLRHGDVTASAVPPRVVVAELTGAGDTLAGTFLAAVAHALSDRDALATAIAAAAEVVASPGIAIPADGGRLGAVLHRAPAVRRPRPCPWRIHGRPIGARGRRGQRVPAFL